jgi:hypothetical protein
MLHHACSSQEIIERHVQFLENRSQKKSIAHAFQADEVRASMPTSRK